MIIKSLDQLNQTSLKIINKINKEDCILLFGEIGVGKTTLTRALINNLQDQNKADKTEVLSPTFNIVYEYEVGNFKIMHYDLYRLKTEKDVQQLGCFDQSEKIKTIWTPYSSRHSDYRNHGSCHVEDHHRFSNSSPANQFLDLHVRYDIC